MRNPTFKQRLTWHNIQLSGLQAVISSFFSVGAIRISLCQSILLIGLCHDSLT